MMLIHSQVVPISCFCKASARVRCLGIRSGQIQELITACDTHKLSVTMAHFGDLAITGVAQIATAFGLMGSSTNRGCMCCNDAAEAAGLRIPAVAMADAVSTSRAGVFIICSSSDFISGRIQLRVVPISCFPARSLIWFCSFFSIQSPDLLHHACWEPVTLAEPSASMVAFYSISLCIVLPCHEPSVLLHLTKG